MLVVMFYVQEQQGMDVFTGGRIFSLEDYGYFGQNDNLKLKFHDGFVSYKHTAFHFTCWTRVVWIDDFISCLDSDGTRSLQRIH